MTPLALRHGMAPPRGGRAEARSSLLGVILIAALMLPVAAGGAARPAPAVGLHEGARTGTATAPSGGPAPLATVGGGPFGDTTGGIGSGTSPSQAITIGSPAWTPAGTTGVSPVSPYASMVYDPLDKEFVAFGGEVPGSGTVARMSNATWILRSGSWSNLCALPDGDGGCGAATPPARAGALLTYDAADKMVLMAGGTVLQSNGSTVFPVGRSDLWAFAGGGWVNLTPRGLPSGLWDGQMTYDAHDGYVLALTDTGATYSFTVAQGFSKVGPIDHPSGRSHAAIFFDGARDAVVVYGGVSAAGKILNDTWSFADGDWTKLDFGHNVPSNRLSSAGVPLLPAPIAATYDAVLSVGVVVDPLDVGGNATWVLGTSGWTNATSTLGGPIPSGYGSTLGYDDTDGIGALLSFPLVDPAVSETYYLSDALHVSPGPLGAVMDANESTTFDPALSGGLPPYQTALGSGASACALLGTTGPSPTITCGSASPGWVNLSVAVSDSAGRSINLTFRITVNGDPMLTLPRVAPDPTSVGVPVQYDALVSYGTAPFTTLNWSFDDGASAVGTSANHSYLSPGTHAVTVRSKDATGREFQVRYVVVVNRGPAASVSSDRSATDPGFAVAFHSAVVGGTGGTTCAWNFGDGSGSTDCAPNHTYARPGTFTARFWSNDTVGATGGASLSVYVAPTLAATVEPTGPAYAGQEIGLMVSESGGIGPYSVAWDFGDGGSARGSSVAHSYGLPGTYVAQAVVTDSLGAQTTVEANLTVDVNGGSLGGSPGSSGSIPIAGGSIHVPMRSSPSDAASTAPWTLLAVLAAIAAAIALAVIGGRARRAGLDPVIPGWVAAHARRARAIGRRRG